METNSLTSDEFWQSSRCVVMANDRDERACKEAELIRHWAVEQESLAGHVLFATSGSTGGSKWVALSRTSLLSSARAVNKHLVSNKKDRWLLALPDFHVGGMGVFARAYDMACSIVRMKMNWDAAAYHSLACAEKVTLSALIPTQIVDLVALGLQAPSSLRAVLIGGGRLESTTYHQALLLGWPIIETYGMTETSSQVATSTLGSRVLELLPCWHAKIGEADRLMIKGEPLLTGYVFIEKGVIQLSDPKENGWFTTDDMVTLENGALFVKGRADRCVKILGELINLSEVESSVRNCAATLHIDLTDFVVAAISDARKGYKLVACYNSAGDIDDTLNIYNANCHPVARIESVFILDDMPRSALGKVLHTQLLAMIQDD